MDASNSDKLQPPKIGGAFARKRLEKEVRDTGVTQDAAPAPIPAQPDPMPVPPPAPTPEPAPAPIPEPAAPPVPAPAPDPVPDPSPQPQATAPRHATPPAAAPAAEPEESLAPLLPLRRHRADVVDNAEDAGATTAVLPRTPAASDPAPQPGKARRNFPRLPTLIASVIAGAAAGATLTGAIWAFTKWGGENDGANALQLVASFVGAIIVGVVVLALGGIAHRTAIAFLGTGAIAVVMMFFPSDHWQSWAGAIGIVVGMALLYAAAHAMTHEATGDR